MMSKPRRITRAARRRARRRRRTYHGDKCALKDNTLGAGVFNYFGGGRRIFTGGGGFNCSGGSAPIILGSGGGYKNFGIGKEFDHSYDKCALEDDTLGSDGFTYFGCAGRIFIDRGSAPTTLGGGGGFSNFGGPPAPHARPPRRPAAPAIPSAVTHAAVPPSPTSDPRTRQSSRARSRGPSAPSPPAGHVLINLDERRQPV